MSSPANRLGTETSPYLLQHADNPVAWQPWDEAALALARAQDRPILLSVGYAACHWCHVMAHESFENPETAALMNADFVNIKVDREERPDLDQIYQAALAMLGEQGGWPLTMFLTPQGEPFWGGTYFPPEARYGRPGFPDVLRAVAGTYAQDKERVAKNVGVLRDGLKRLAAPQPGGLVGRDTLFAIAERLLAAMDMRHGGLGQAPKFPQCGVLRQLWRAWMRGGDSRFLDAVRLAAERMSEGGIFDHLGGGFARYSTDERWLAPHFEKMLYDNAELIEILTLVWLGTDDPLFADRVRQTVGWLQREMLVPEGGFASSLDADTEGEEGRFYVWSAAEVQTLLGADYPLFARIYDVTPAGNWEGHTILNRLEMGARPDAEQEAVLARCRAVLFEARARRPAPGLDDKVLLDWNGMVVAALARAAMAFGEPEWLALAERAFAFLQGALRVDGRFRHSWRLGRAANPAGIDDYAQIIRAALWLYQATGRDDYLAHARDWVAEADRLFGDGEQGGYFQTAADQPDLVARVKQAQDAATPAGAAVMAENLGLLWLLTGEDAYRLQAEATIECYIGEIERNFFPLSTLLGANALLDEPVQVVIAGARGDAAADALDQAVWRMPLTDMVISRIGPDDRLPDTHPAAGKGMVQGQPAAYVCVGRTCSLPFTEPDRLRAYLAEV